MPKRYVMIDYEFLHQTDNAVLILTHNGKIWVPRSVIRYGHDVDWENDYELDFEMEIEEWFAIQEELI